jgi:hypothetical protein
MLKRMAVAEARFTCAGDDPHRSVFVTGETPQIALRKARMITHTQWDRMPFWLSHRCRPHDVRLVNDGETLPIYLHGAHPRRRRRARRRG